MTSDAHTTRIDDAVRTLARQGTWMILVDGILLILLGVFLVIPSETAHDMLIRGLGILLIAAAIAVGARLWSTATNRSHGPATWLGCIAPLVLGLILLIWPHESLEAIAITIGVVVLIRGIIETSVALANRTGQGWEIPMVRGLVTIAVGIFFLAFRSWAAYLLLILLGIDLIARGAMNVSIAREVRRAARN